MEKNDFENFHFHFFVFFFEKSLLFLYWKIDFRKSKILDFQKSNIYLRKSIFQ